MTTHDLPHEPTHARTALGAHLLRVDFEMMQAGVPRAQRDATLQQVAEQFHDQLGEHPDAATRDRVRAALAALGPERAYHGEQPTTPQLLRQLWVRLMGSTTVPLALNDGGRKRIVWGEVVKRMTYMIVILTCLSLVSTGLLMGRFPDTTALMFQAIFAVCLVWGIRRKLRRMPVESLPMAEDWPDEMLYRHRWSWVVMFLCSGLIVGCCMIGAYLVAAVARGKPAWPLDPGAKVGALVTICVLSFAMMLLDFWLRRRNRLRVERCAAAPCPAESGRTC